MYWSGNQLQSAAWLLLSIPGTLAIVLGLVLVMCASFMFLEDCFDKKPTLVMQVLLGLPLVAVSSLFFFAVVKVGVSALAH